MLLLRQIFAWTDKLRRCEGIYGALKVLAEGMADLSGAQAVGIFLLEQSKVELELQYLWSKEISVPLEQKYFISVDDLEDPLSFSLYSGKRCFVSALEANTNKRIHATKLMLNLTGEYFFCAEALPLFVAGNESFGAILLAYEKKTCSGAVKNGRDELLLLSGYGAEVLKNFIQNQNHAALFRSFDEDISRLKKEQSSSGNNDLGIVGQSEAIERVRALIRKAAPSNATVLICGETGTGKELVAEAIHALSPRREERFVKINCAAIPTNLLESELFGYRKGAFSGASRDSLGLLRSADRGTLLLDEIGDMSMDLQVKLLRFLQEKRVHPIGDTQSYPVDVRIIAATNLDLKLAVDAGSFRLDIYHRLAVFPIHLPPLRERAGDIPLLAVHFLNHAKRRHSRPGLSLPMESVNFLCGLIFSGNVRELEACIERAVLMAENDKNVLGMELFMNSEANIQRTLPESLAAYEFKLIEDALQMCSGSRKDAANILGIPVRTLAYKLQQAAFRYNPEA